MSLDKDLFLHRLARYYQFVKTDDKLGSLNGFILLKGKELDAYSKSQSFHIWLTGHELPETCFLFLTNAIHILTSRKKADLLKTMTNEKENADLPPIKIHSRDLANQDKTNIEDLISAIKSVGTSNSIGYLGKTKTEGTFTENIMQGLQSHNIKCVDVTESIALLLAVKEESEVKLLQKSAEVSCAMLTKYARAQAIEAIESDKKVKHSDIAAGCETALSNKKFNLGLDPEDLDMCYPLIVQSGGEYALKFSVESSDANLRVGTMIFAIGVRYRSYCANVIRTYLVNPTPSQSDCYSFLHQLHEFAIKEIRDGLAFSKLAEMLTTKVEKEKPAYKDHLLRLFGFVTGIEFRDSNLLINQKSTGVFRKNMSLNLQMGFQDVPVELEKKKSATESYWIGDIVIVGRDADGSGENDVLTKQCRSALSKVSMIIKEEDNESEEETKESGKGKAADKSSKKSKEQSVAEVVENLGRGQRGAVLAQKTRNENNVEDERLKHQLEVFEKLLKDVADRLTGLRSTEATQKKQKSTISYKSLAQMPRDDDLAKLRVFVDKKYDTLILPIFGVAYPLHISTVKNVATSVEGDYTYLRINLNHPGAPVAPGGTAAAAAGGAGHDLQAFYVKEVTLRASNTRLPGAVGGDAAHIPSTSLNTAFRLLKEMQKKFKTREAEEREMEDLVEQDRLVCLAKPAARLKDVFMRPNVFGKRMMGVLETHQNGFRYTNIRGDKVDILFNNIKHAFYQPCDSEIIILLHFHLKNGVLLNKKKHIDIQFYTEVGETTTDLDRAHGYSHRDKDDIESEHREREMRMVLKNAFQSFCEKATAASNDTVDFDTPFRDLGFNGAPFRSTVLLQPTSNCLVSLVEWPPFVVSLDEVEFFYFERVSLNIRTFDMAIVLKDYKQKPLLISSIDASSLDDIKNWIDTNDIFYAEGVKNLNWPKLLKTINDDPRSFLEEGGWSFLKPLDDEEEEEEDLQEDDEEFVPSDSEEEEEGSGSEEDDSEDDSEDEEESDWSAENGSSGSEELDSDESEGKDWDELEAIARREDAERAEVDERKTQKRPATKGTKSSPPPKRRK